MNFAVLEIGEETLFLRFTAQAYAELQEKYGTIAKAFDVLQTVNVNALVDILEVLARCGELSRRYLGYDHAHIYTTNELMTIIQPNDIVNIRQMMTSAFMDGIGERQQEGNVDLGLVQLNKEKPLDLSVLYRAALTMGMSLKELYMTPIGQIFDMMEAKNGN